MKSNTPLNSLFLPEPRSVASLVRAKSNGYAAVSVSPPATPPDIMLPIRNSHFYVLGSYGQNVVFNASLFAKFKACEIDCLSKLGQFPLQSDKIPCYLIILLRQSVIPLNL